MAKYRVKKDPKNFSDEKQWDDPLPAAGTEFEWDGARVDVDGDIKVYDDMTGLSSWVLPEYVELVEPDIASSVTPITEQKVVTEVTGVKLNVELPVEAARELHNAMAVTFFTHGELERLYDQLAEAINA